MKKSVIILILIIYIGSIVFVGFFGMKMQAYNPTIIPTSISCINTEEDHSSTLKITEVEDKKEGDYLNIALYWQDDLTYQIKWKVEPVEAEQDVIFSYDKTCAEIDNKTGIVKFLKKNAFDVIIMCEEFPTKSQRIRFVLI